MDSKLNANRTRDRYRSRQTNRLTLTRKQRDGAREIGEGRVGGGGGGRQTLPGRCGETEKQTERITTSLTLKFIVTESF